MWPDRSEAKNIIGPISVNFEDYLLPHNKQKRSLFFNKLNSTGIVIFLVAQEPYCLPFMRPINCNNLQRQFDETTAKNALVRNKLCIHYTTTAKVQVINRSSTDTQPCNLISTQLPKFKMHYTLSLLILKIQTWLILYIQGRPLFMTIKGSWGMVF